MTIREHDFPRSEDEVSEEERTLLSELRMLEQAARGLHERLMGARAQLTFAECAGFKNPELARKLASAAIPTLDMKPIRDRAVAARAAALSARVDCNQQLRQGLKDFKAELTAFSQQLVLDEPRVEQLATDARAARIEVTEKEPDLPRSDDEPMRVARREQARVQMQVAIDFGSQSNFYTGFSTNLSDGGVFIATASPFEVGTGMDLNFELPGAGKIEAYGVVRWVCEVTGSKLPGMGVQFTRLDERDRAAIHAFVATREPLFFPD